MFRTSISILLIISILLPQKTYEFTEEEVQSLYTSIQELENADIQRDSLCQSQI